MDKALWCASYAPMCDFLQENMFFLILLSFRQDFVTRLTSPSATSVNDQFSKTKTVTFSSQGHAVEQGHGEASSQSVQSDSATPSTEAEDIKNSNRSQTLEDCPPSEGAKENLQSSSGCKKPHNRTGSKGIILGEKKPHHYSTHRDDPVKAMEHWRHEIGFEVARVIDSHCGHLYQLLGYRAASTKEDLENTADINLVDVPQVEGIV